MPITILDLAKHRGAKEDPDSGFSAEAIEATGLPFFSGCGSCGETLGPFNAYPSKLGTIRCKTCIEQNGFETVEEANAEIFPPEYENPIPPEYGDCDCCCCDNCSEYSDENDSRFD